MKIAIASDHAGFELKQQIAEFLQTSGYNFNDLGTHNTDSVDYPDYAEAVGTAIADKQVERAVLICGSGVGASIAANKMPGVRAGLCHDTYSAHQGVEHDDMNVLVLGARVIGTAMAHELVGAFLNARFTSEPRHLRRLQKVLAIESKFAGEEHNEGETNTMDATQTTGNPLQQLAAKGQSPWIDYMRRSFITSGELAKLVENDGLKGITSNPAIFEKAIGGSDDYDDAIRELAPQSADAKSLYEQLAIKDIQDAADVLKDVYETSNRTDGCVSLEVAPGVAHDTDATLIEAHRLWETVDRPNLMIKVPATAAGIPAVQQLISEGINVNITLLFSQEAYRQVAEAYIAGLEKRHAEGGDVRHVASVASFFISRIDTAVDALINEKLVAENDPDKQKELQSLLGKAAIANAKVTYGIYQELFSGERWQKLADAGAHPQRLLWASTSTKNPSYRDVIYVEELIGRDTVNTMPPATWDAFRDHGEVRESITENVDEAREVLESLEKHNITFKDATDKLLVDAVRLFVEPFDKMIAAVEKAMQQKAGATP